MYTKTEIYAIISLAWSVVGLTLMLASAITQKGRADVREIDAGAAVCAAATFVFACLTLISILRSPETACAQFAECGGVIAAGIAFMLATLVVSRIKRRIARKSQGT